MNIYLSILLKFKNTLNSLALSIIVAVIIGSPFVLIAIKERDVTLEKVQIIDFKILSEICCKGISR